MIWGTSGKMGYRYHNRIAHLQGCGGWAEGSLTELLVVFLRVADLFINHQLLSLTQSVGPGMFPPFGSYDGEELEDEGWVGWRVLGSVFSKTGDASMLPSAHRPSLPSFSHSLAREAETLDPHQYRPNANWSFSFWLLPLWGLDSQHLHLRERWPIPPFTLHVFVKGTQAYLV